MEEVNGINGINIYGSCEALYAGFTEFLNGLINENSSRRTNVALSGGETPKALFDYWASGQGKADWSRVNFFWGDERCVPADDAESNFGMAKHHLLDKIGIGENQIFRIQGENHPEDEAARYGQLLAEVLPSSEGFPRFDLVMLGLGTDGHTASIFPHQICLWEASSNCVVAQHPGTGQLRVSLSGRVINQAAHVAFLVTGISKREKVRSIIEDGEAYLNKYPAAHVRPVEGVLHWFLDEAAAKSI